MSLPEASEAVRRRVLRPWMFRAYLLVKIPLAAFAGLRIDSLDETSCTVRLLGGWRTQNPFRSTYFAAQAMAAEMSTGAPAMMFVAGATAPVSLLVRDVRGVFTKKAVGPTRFSCDDVAAIREVVERAARTGESESFTARSVGRDAGGAVVAEFEVTWSFKRRD